MDTATIAQPVAASPSPKIILSGEQQEIIATPPDEAMRIMAFAGCAKTTTLVEYARAWVRPSAYLAFNQQVAAEARQRFPDHTICRTAHAHAYHVLGMNRYQQRIVTRFLPEHFQSLPLKLATERETRQLQSQIARAITKWCNSDLPVVTEDMVPEKVSWRREMIADIANDTARLLIRWENQTDFPITHDLYLKRLALERSYDWKTEYVLVDEAQDLNGVILQLLSHTAQPIIYVGDPYQSIYAFRGARNVLEQLQATTFPLTTSWRFGPELAELANRILSWHGRTPKLTLHGNPKQETKIRPYNGTVSRGAFLIARTNARLFGGLLQNLMPYHMIGGADDMLHQVYSAYLLWRGHHDKNPHPHVKRFKVWESLLIAAETEADQDASRLRSIIEQYGEYVPAAIDSLRKLHCPNPDDAYYTVSTAHKAKGLERDDVILLDDLHSPLDLKMLLGRGRLSIEAYNQEINLLYVAATRAKRTLQMPAVILSVLYPDSNTTGL